MGCEFWCGFLSIFCWYQLSILYLYFLYNFHDLVCFSLFVFSLFLFLLLFFNIVFLKFQTLLQILIFAFMYLLPILYLSEPNPQDPFFTRERDYWLDCSPSLWTLLFLHQVACVSSLTPLYSTQLCEFLCVPDGGEHLGN